VNDLRNANGGIVNPAVDKHFGFLPGVTYPHLIAVEPRWPKPSTTSAPRSQSLFWSEF